MARRGEGDGKGDGVDCKLEATCVCVGCDPCEGNDCGKQTATAKGRGSLPECVLG